MFKLLDGRAELYQWDLDRKVIVYDPTIHEVHFCNKESKHSLVTEVYELDGQRVADIPNILLQDIWPIRAYGQCGQCYVKDSTTFNLIRRAKPDDYIYTETEIYSVEELAKEIFGAEVEGLKQADKENSDAIGALRTECETTLALVEKIEERTEVWYPMSLTELVAPTTVTGGAMPVSLAITNEGEGYVVEINGEKSAYTSKKLTLGDAAAYYIGNLSLIDADSFENTGETFLLFGNVLFSDEPNAVIAIYSHVIKYEILPEISYQGVTYKFVSPVLFSEGDAIYAKINGEEFVGVFAFEEELGGLYALFNDNSNYARGAVIVLEGYNCEYQCLSLNDTNTTTLELSQKQCSFETIPEEYLPTDNELNLESERPVKNKVVTKAIGDISAALDELHAYAQSLMGGNS